ncbi:MAG TPA: STAS domain-containing protein [Chitinophagales bacterium]|nr:STAS domain-containing protein [Chitinophagales bacterium]
MKSELKDGVLIIPFEGSVVGAVLSADLAELLKTNIEAGNNKVVFDMANMKYVDSTGLGMMLNAVSKLKAAGGKLVLCSVPEQMTKLLKMTKLEMAFHQQADEAAAIAFLKA